MSPLSIQPESPALKAGTTLRTLTLFGAVYFTTYFFSREKMPINMNIPVFFLGKCVLCMVVDRKKPEGTSSAIFCIRTAAKCCELKHCAD